MENETTEKVKPIIDLFSNGVSLRIYPKKKEEKTYYQVSMHRKYVKDGQDVYETMHFFPDVMLPMAELLREGFSMLNSYKLEVSRKKKEIQKAWEEAQCESSV
jgi:hypothetical protein